LEFEEFYRVEAVVENLFRADFYFPALSMVLEFNGVDHFYPYVSQGCNYTNFKTKVLNLAGSTPHFGGPVP
jgi:hypothetical protein